MIATFNYEPREHIWRIVHEVHEEGKTSVPNALSIIQEYIYCVEGVLYPIEQPKNEEETNLMGYAFSVAYNRFLTHVR